MPGIRRQRRHEFRAVIADGDEVIDVADLFADQVQRLIAIGRSQTVEEQLLALQRAAHRPIQCFAKRRRQRDKQGVGKVDDVRQRLVADPVEQLVEFFAEHAVGRREHRDRQIAQQFGIVGDRTAGDSVDDQGESQKRSRKRGVLRKIAEYCCR